MAKIELGNVMCKVHPELGIAWWDGETAMPVVGMYWLKDNEQAKALVGRLWYRPTHRDLVQAMVLDHSAAAARRGEGAAKMPPDKGTDKCE